MKDAAIGTRHDELPGPDWQGLSAGLQWGLDAARSGRDVLRPSGTLELSDDARGDRGFGRSRMPVERRIINTAVVARFARVEDVPDPRPPPAPVGAAGSGDSWKATSLSR